MIPTIIDLTVLFLIAGMTYALMSEGLWGAALMFFNALFASLVALNFYEPLATLIATNAAPMAGFADSLCILLLFSATLLILRLITENLAPAMIRFPMVLYHVGRIVFGLLGSLVTIGVLLVALDAAPVQKRMFGVYDYEYKPMYKTRFDKEMLAFFQFTTGYAFSRSGGNDPLKEYGDARIFDPAGDWLIRTQQARPHGEGPILKSETPAAEAGTAGGTASPNPAGGAGRRGDPGPGIPGGTAGAAAGLAPTQ